MCYRKLLQFQILMDFSFDGFHASWPGQFVQVGEDSLGDALYEVMVEAEGVDADQLGDGLPGNVHQVVVAQIQVLQSLQEVLQEDKRRARRRWRERKKKEMEINNTVNTVHSKHAVFSNCLHTILIIRTQSNNTMSKKHKEGDGERMRGRRLEGER